jgi:hypothetical protein
VTQRFIFSLPNSGSGGSHLCIKLKATTKKATMLAVVDFFKA